MPKKKEFFQDKVEAVPAKSKKREELERQAVVVIEDKVKEARLAAVVENASTNITKPLSQAEVVVEALGDSMGPPYEPFKGTSEKLASKIETEVAKDNEKLADYRDDVSENVGKKIEGTGKIQMGYFTYAGLVLGGIALLVILIRVGLSVAANMYPGVGVGLNMLKLPGRAVAKGLSEVLEGGEHFKDLLVEEKKLEDQAKNIVLDLFKRAQVEKQSRDTQSIIKQVTN